MFAETGTSRRAAFTLIELLVVMSIIILLAAISVVLYPRISDQVKIANGADNLQGWLLIAKQRAKADQLPTGLRFTADPTTGFYTQVEYIQQPDDYAPPNTWCTGYSQNPGTSTTNPNGYSVTFSGTTFTNVYGGSGTADQYAVMVGDYLEIYGGGPVRLIIGVTDSSGNASATTLQLGPTTTPLPANPPGAPPNPQPAGSPVYYPNYRIIRQPRLLVGEPALALPQDVGVDPTNSLNVPSVTVNGQALTQILFSPSGSVIGSGTTNGMTFFWVSGLAGTPAASFQPTIIAVQARSGFISAHPVDPNGTDPYAFAKDGRSSGL